LSSRQTAIGLPSREDIQAIVEARHGDPFAVLGPHTAGAGIVVNVFAPDAESVAVVDAETGRIVATLDRVHDAGFFSGTVARRSTPFRYRLECTSGEHRWQMDDPYAFGPFFGEMDDYLVAEGRHLDLYRRLGSHPVEHEGASGVAFSVWAPNAARVSVVGDFNGWDGRRHPMRKRLGTGVWELFVPGIGAGSTYKYELLAADGSVLPLKADPFAFAQEAPPRTASLVHGLPRHDWSDGAWMRTRSAAQDRSAPVSIYEMHLGSWRRGGNGEMLDYGAIGDLLIPYLKSMDFTHVEFLPVSEHPFTGSWGYQPIGLFAPTARFGSPEDFAGLVDALHQAGIGVILDWVPAHFPSDIHGLARFDGTALYEHEDPRLGFHRDWNTLIYNFGRREVANFLTANALFWLDQYHVDALRVDAVASMIYLDYSREPGEWVPNREGGNENLEAIAFLREMNTRVYERSEGIATIAEESTAWPGISRPVHSGGLGFGYKWNMGWMHDTLDYMSREPVHRRYHHGQMTFGIDYAFSENFVLPLSHDEVVHGKGSLLGKMPGDRWQKFANLRAYYGFMWGHPGKKLLFMGGEFAQEREWNHDLSLDWHLMDDASHRGVHDLVGDLNRLYLSERALHERDCEPQGFQWVEGGDTVNSVFSFLRRGGEGSRPVLVVSNMTPVVRLNHRVGVPVGGAWTELLNTDAARYGGSNAGNQGRAVASGEGRHGMPASLSLTLPPLATIFLAPEA
jgi:1,4-alpha-glucan branching enzyme